MKMSTLDAVLWIGSFVMPAVLLAVFCLRGRWREFPVFTSWVAFATILNSLLFALYLHDSRVWYSRIYWGRLWPEFLLQLGVVIEIARIVLRPTGTWVQDARAYFITAGLGGAAVAAILSWWITPPHGAYSTWELRGDLFTSLVICELFAAMSFTANRLGLGWRNHVMALGQGLTVWAGAALVTNALESYLSTHHFVLAEHLQTLAWIGATAWIAVRLWVPEPERLPISEDLQKYILALHRRVEYDLRRLDAGH